MTDAAVVDTKIASAWLGVKHLQRKARWAPILEPAVWVLPFTDVAEMRSELPRTPSASPQA